MMASPVDIFLNIDNSSLMPCDNILVVSEQFASLKKVLIPCAGSGKTD